MSVYAGPNATSSGLVLHIDPSNPRCYPGSGSTLFDLSGGGNNGTLTNGASVVNQRSGRALDFDGTDDWVDITRGLNILGGVSVAAWIKPSGTVFADSAAIFTNVFNGSTVQITLAGGNNPINAGNKRVWGGFYDGGWKGVFALQDTTFQEWSFCCVTYDGSVFSIYLNGQRSNTANYTGTVPATTLGYRVGRRWDSGVNGSNVFSGNLDDIRLYNRALTPQEIINNFNATRGRYGI